MKITVIMVKNPAHSETLNRFLGKTFSLYTIPAKRSGQTPMATVRMAASTNTKA